MINGEVAAGAGGRSKSGMNTSRELPPDLVFSHGDEPGFSREKVGKTFRYRDTRGKQITNEAQLKRIRALAIPPAYRNVWISPIANAHLQATGVDARGRKQYRYHPRWREFKDENKFHRMLDFAKALPPLRRRVARDLARPGLDHEKMIAAVVALLEATLIRVGNEEYARDNHHYGLTTLRERHVELHGKHLRFHFTGKSGVERDVQLDDERLAKVVKGLLELPGQLLFRFRGEDKALHKIRSEDVNEYLQRITGQPFTAKDFRTWAGTVFCAVSLTTLTRDGATPRAKTTVMAAVKQVASRLGNTPAVCRKSYIHPVIIDEYLANGMEQLRLETKRALDFRHHLHEAESEVLKLLESALKRKNRDLSSQLRDSLKQLKKKNPAGRLVRKNA